MLMSFRQEISAVRESIAQVVDRKPQDPLNKHLLERLDYSLEELRTADDELTSRAAQLEQLAAEVHAARARYRVLFMTIPGLSLFYAGMVRAKNALSVMMQCFTITCLISILWMVYIYSLAFGDDIGSFIGSLNKAFMSGVTGQYFRQFGLVVVAATLFSLVVSFTLTPLLASRWLRAHNPSSRSPLAFFGRYWDRWFEWLARGYERLVGGAV